jgi:hypothetical protein
VGEAIEKLTTGEPLLAPAAQVVLTKYKLQEVLLCKRQLGETEEVLFDTSRLPACEAAIQVDPHEGHCQGGAPGIRRRRQKVLQARDFRAFPGFDEPLNKRLQVVSAACVHEDRSGTCGQVRPQVRSLASFRETGD